MNDKPDFPSPGRRAFLRATGAGLVLAAPLARAAVADDDRGRGERQAPAVIASLKARPGTPSGVMAGDVTGDRAVVWSRTDRPALMTVEYGVAGSRSSRRRVTGPAALPESAFTARVDLHGLPPGQEIEYRVQFQDLTDFRALSEPLEGRFRTPPAHRHAIRFAFSGDEAGQGWGINPELGGYRLYETMRRFEPDFFIHSGDQIYADGVIRPEVTLDDGSIWRNVVTAAKTKVAETLDEFRGNFAYNLLDENKRRFAAEVPFLVQWDDHEVRNNWYPGQLIGIPAYAEKRASVLAARARQALLEFNPFRLDPRDPNRIYRAFHYGPSLDIFMLDERSYRGPNSPNRQPALDDSSAFLGGTQLAWLKQALAASQATWKVIASDMPLGLVVPDGNPDVPPGTFEAWANADDGAPLGRERELADLLSFIKRRNIRNVVWVTADVHYAAAHYYHPARARFTDFKPFWEFVGGPINAGTFGPNALDLTFGPEVKFTSLPPGGIRPNRPPSEGLQFFGLAEIDRQSERMTVALVNQAGEVLYRVELDPEA